MPETPPPYANYPRNAPATGSAAQLQSLADGYFGLSAVFGINLVIALLINAAAQTAVLHGAALVGAWVGVGVLIAFLTLPANRKIGYGAGWPPAKAVVASVLMGVNSALCCGIIGYAVMQTIASNHMKRYGVKLGLFAGKKQVRARVAELQAQEGSTGAI